MREAEGYREMVADLRAFFGENHNLLSPKDVAKYCGRDVRTIKKNYKIPKVGITIPMLARQMCR